MPKPSTDKAKVQWILERSQKARNSNVILYKLILKHFLKVNLKGISAFELLTGMKEKIYPDYSNVARASRKLQELHPELRGSEWKKRHGLQSETVEDLKTNF